MTLITCINFIRDVLRTEGLVGSDSLDHCIIFMVARMLNDKTCERLNINTKNTFANLYKLVENKKNPERIYKEFVSRNEEDDSIVFNIVNKFHFTALKFKLNNPDNLISIIKKLNELDIDYLEQQNDILGTVYEIHLKSGTKSGAMRDLGQFYTNRLVIDFMIKLCKPKLTDIIIDPTCGTVGFLTMAVKSLVKHNKDIDWDILQKNIIGYDIDEHIVNLAILNMFLETGYNFSESINKRDTLKNGMSFHHDKADIILANEPMGIKGIKYDNKHLCQRILDLNISGTKGEPLFLQLFGESLNEKGRICVIVPDGVLFNESKQHIETRKYLVRNFNLQKVVALNDDFFMNTGVKTSILYYVKNGKTKQIEFSEIHLKDKEIEEKSIIKVKYSKIKEANYSLFVNKYNATKIDKIEGIEYKKLGDICKFMSKSKRQASYGKDIGEYLFYTSSKKIQRCDEADYDDECLIIGTGGNANIKIDNNFSCSADNFVLKSNNDNIITKFIYHYLSNNIDVLENGFNGTTIKHLSKDYLKNIEIPIPSLEIQERIVEQLDVINSNIEKSKQMVDEYRKIIKYYVDSQTKNEKEYKFKDICTTETGEYIKKNDFDEGEYPVYGGGDVSKYINKTNRQDTFVIAKDGVSENCVRYINGKFFLNHHGWTLDYKDDNLQESKYIYYWLYANQHKLYNLANGSAQKGINQNSFYNLTIQIPYIEKQKEIVEYCDNLSNMITQLEKQMENNKILMKNIMNNYLEKNE